MATLPTEQQRMAREWVQENGHPCPHCGGRVVVQIDSKVDVGPTLAALAAVGVVYRLVSVEDAEAGIVKEGYMRRSIDPIGGKRS